MPERGTLLRQIGSKGTCIIKREKKPTTLKVKLGLITASVRHKARRLAMP